MASEANPTLDSAIDSLLAPPPEIPVSAPVETPVASEAPVEVPAVEAVPAPAVEESKPVVVADPAVDPAEPAVEVDPESDEDLDAAMASTIKTNPLDLGSSRGKRIYQSYKAFKQVSEALGEDLTVENAQRYRDSYVDNEAMRFEFESGEPERAQNFLKFWNESNPAAMTAVAKEIPMMLAQSNPAAYAAVAVPVLNIYTNGLYQRAQDTSLDPKMREALLYAARMMDWDLNSKFKADGELAGGQPAQQPQPTAVDQRLAEIQRYEQGRSAQQRSAWETQLDETNSRVLDTESDQSLAPLKAAFSPRAYNALRRDFIEAVIAEVSKDQSGEQLYQIQRQRAAGRLSPQDIAGLSAQYQRRAQRAVRALAPAFLKENGVALTTQSAARHSALAAGAAAGKAPQGSGAPVPQSIIPGGRKFASKSEELDATIDGLLGGAV